DRALRGRQQTERSGPRGDVGDARAGRERGQPQRLAREGLEVGEGLGGVGLGDQIPGLGCREDAHLRVLPQPGVVGTTSGVLRSASKLRAGAAAASRSFVMCNPTCFFSSFALSKISRGLGSGPAMITSLRALSAPEIVFSSATRPVASMTGTRPRWMINTLN